MKTKSIFCLIVVFICHITLAAVVTNISSGGPEYATVAAAVTAAVSGDTLLLSTGVFAENIDIVSDKLLTFKGGYLFDFSAIVPGEKSVIDGISSGQSCIDVISGGLNLFDIELTDGGSASYGGGLDYHAGTTGTIVNCYIHNNLSRRGGGIYIRGDAFVTMTNTVVANNHALTYGGGIASDGGSLIAAQNCYIRDNVAVKMGGGIYANDANVLIEGTNTFLGVFYLWSGANSCTNGDGGGMYAINSDIVLSGAQCYAGYNYSNRDGGAFYLTNSSLSLLDGSQITFGWTSRNGGGIYALNSEIVMDNASIMACAGTNGGGIFAMSSTGTFNNSIIAHNNAIPGLGGGIIAVSTGSYFFTDSVIVDNKAHNGGGIVAYLSVGDFILDNTDVISNRAVNVNSFGGGIYWWSAATLEAINGSRISYNLSDDNIGGAYLPAPGTFLFNDSEMSYNIASNHVGGMAVANGGQIECTDCGINNNVADADTNGVGNVGAIYINNASADIISLNGTSTVTNNSGFDGGAAYVLSGGQLSAYGDVLFANNRAVQFGGGIFATNNCTVSLMPTNGASPRFVNNSANNTGGGAAIYADSEFTAVNTWFENNICSNLGGAIYAVYNSKVNIKSDFSNASSLPPNTFLNNHSGFMGGAIIVNIESELNISDAVIISNSADYFTGGIIASQNCTAQFVNAVIAHNSSPLLASAFVGSANHYVSFKNCTIADNLSNAVWNISGPPIEMENCIVWDNQGEIVLSNCTAQYSDIQDGWPGTGNITNNPMFVDSGMLNYQLIAGSECIDKGAIIASITNDCIGNPRPMGLGYDIGAYELDTAPILNVVPLELDFGDVVVGDNADLPVTVGNLGNGPLNGTIINVMNPFFSIVSGSPYSVAPLSSNVVTFRFSPIAVLPITNIVTFTSNGGDTNVVLIGFGIPEPMGIWIMTVLCALFCKRNTLFR